MRALRLDGDNTKQPLPAGGVLQAITQQWQAAGFR